MSPVDFPSTFPLVLGVFLIEMVLVHHVAFRELAGAGADPARRESRHLRDHVVNALLRAGLYGLLVAGAGTVLWMARAGWGVGSFLWGAEFLLASLVLSLGLAALAVRFSLHALDRGQDLRRVMVVRAGFLLAGALYVVALGSRGKASPGEHLLAFLLLGVALLVLGLNRIACLPVVTLAKLAGARTESGSPGSG
jgi:hypothetical protein